MVTKLVLSPAQREVLVAVADAAFQAHEQGEIEMSGVSTERAELGAFVVPSRTAYITDSSLCLL
jgi:hypothetical protein